MRILKHIFQLGKLVQAARYYTIYERNFGQISYVGKRSHKQFRTYARIVAISLSFGNILATSRILCVQNCFESTPFPEAQ